MIDALTFSKTPWLANAFQPECTAQIMGSVEEVGPLLQSDPASFLAPPYTRPYEDWCVEDHEAAKGLTGAENVELAVQAAKNAYLGAWEVLPDPEFCGLISDDVETIVSLLLMPRPLRAFTMERMQWYLRGRAPWGYSGEFPHGKWIIV
jgi:hypothetical protein